MFVYCEGAEVFVHPPDRKVKDVTVVLNFMLSTLLLGSSPQLSPQFVPGEILIKFVPGSEGSRAVGQASPPDLGALRPVLNALQAKTGIPLNAKQVTGGNWVLLSVDGGRLTDRMLSQLRRREGVALVEVSPERPDAQVGFSFPRRLVVRFAPGSPESDAVAQRLAGVGDDRFAQLIRDLERELDLPLRGEATEDAKVLVQVDLKALTPIVVERLKSLCDIDSVQPNYIVTIQ